jgi:glutamyl-tRNA reductase
LAGTDLETAHNRLRSTGRQIFLLSTCLRLEIAWVDGPDSIEDVVTCLYGDRSFSDLARVRHDDEAFLYLCRIAAGLCSPVIGEPEVLSQFRHAASTTHESEPTPGPLGRVLNAAVAVGRSARRQMDHVPTGSLAILAARTAASFERVAILGAGAMARAATENLADAEVSVFARRPTQLAGHETRPWEDAVEALASFPVVISTVPGSSRLFSNDALHRALSRRGEPLLLIDLGMPPGFHRPDPGHPVRYLGVDDVASSIGARPPLEVEEHVVDRAASTWHRLAASDRVGVVIAAMVGQAEAAVREEVERFAKRLETATDPEPLLRQLAHTVARRVLHPSISYVGSAERGAEAVEVFAEAFGVDDG